MRNHEEMPLRGGLAEGNGILWGIVLGQQMMILQGVNHWTLKLRCMNGPKKGGVCDISHIRKHACFLSNNL